MVNVYDTNDADWLIERVLREIQFVSGKPRVLAIAGHAAVGKTSVALGLLRRVPNAVRLETESCILGMRERLDRKASGCAIEAHDVSLYRRHVEDILDGRIVTFCKYDWKTRARTGDRVITRLPPNGLLILDGTISCHPEIAAYCDKVIFLKPTSYEDWLKFAIERDIRERWRTRSISLAENQAKYLDAKIIEVTYADCISETVTVSIRSGKPSPQNLAFAFLAKEVDKI